MSDHDSPAPAPASAPSAAPRSPPRKPKKSNNSGFKWKQKPSGDDDGTTYSDRRDNAPPSRYDERPSASRQRDDNRDRDRDRDYRRGGGDEQRDYRHPDRRGGGGDEREYRHPDRRGGGGGGEYSRNRSRSRSPRRERDRGGGRDRSRDREARPRADKKKEKDKAPPAAPVVAAAADGEEMIIVHVNDRLGTKAAIPCFASDDIKSFKVMVAARIGREPHEILLKRQGERPFRDHITLEDYGVSNGVQLDLEVDTGD